MFDNLYSASRSARESAAVRAAVPPRTFRNDLDSETARLGPRVSRAVTAIVAIVLSQVVVFAQQAPWERAAMNLELTFTGPLARSLALVAIVIGGLMFMFGEGGAKRQISGIVFGGGLALFAAQFLTWLF